MRQRSEQGSGLEALFFGGRTTKKKIRTSDFFSPRWVLDELGFSITSQSALDPSYVNSRCVIKCLFVIVHANIWSSIKRMSVLRSRKKKE